MDESLSLILFTLLVPASAGLLLMSEAGKPQGGTAQDILLRRRVFNTVFLLQTGGLLASFFHLGTPLHAVHALRNLGSSWLSREILMTGVYTFLLSGYGAVLFFRPQAGKLRKILYEITLGTAAALIYTMIRLYMMPLLPGWDHAATPVSLVTLAVGLGSVSFALLVGRQAHLTQGKMILIAGIALLLNAFNRLWLLLSGTWEVSYLSAFHLLVAAAALLTGLLILRRRKMSVVSLRVFAILWFAAALLERIAFFTAWDRIGL